MKINKESPPGRFQYDWDEIVAMAKANPGEWVSPDREYPHSTISALSRGKNSLFPMDEFTFRSSGTRHDFGTGRRMCKMHIRYNPKESN